ncbi:MAG: hypothetical protein WC829_03290 [Hyphomicrobium sp.]|jgi:hypothetical protein
MSTQTTKHPNRPWETPAADLVEEVEWLLSFGIHPDQIAQAIGKKTASIERALYRQGRADLVTKLQGRAA